MTEETNTHKRYLVSATVPVVATTTVAVYVKAPTPGDAFEAARDRLARVHNLSSPCDVGTPSIIAIDGEKLDRAIPEEDQALHLELTISDAPEKKEAEPTSEPKEEPYRKYLVRVRRPVRLFYETTIVVRAGDPLHAKLIAEASDGPALKISVVGEPVLAHEPKPPLAG